MLTFRFTGVNGEMIEEEMLAAGMVGKQVQFAFSEDWDGLRKVAVYKAGNACCTTVDVETADTIPAEVLACSLQRLQVGIYGISEDGSVVTPTIYATGPFIHISAVLGEDPCFDPENTFWIRLEEAIGELTELSTEEKTSLVLAINENWTHINELAEQAASLEEEALRFTAQTLTQEQQAQARQNIGAVSTDELPTPVLDETAAKLLLTILQNGVYASDQSENILRLSAAVCGTEVYGITYVLENVTTDNSGSLLADGDSYTAVLSAANGYALDTVTVTMGGADITQAVYADGVISIPAVTGEVVITASAVTQEIKLEILYIAASVFDYRINLYNENNTNRISAVTTTVVADTPFPISSASTLGDLYILPIPETATAIKVTSPGFIGAPQFYTLADGIYTQTLDSGWQTENSFDHAITAGPNQFVSINFKKSDNSVFAISDIDTSGFTVEFE